MSFKFHPMSDQLKLSHHMFDYDLLLFSKDYVASIMVISISLATFFKASVLYLGIPINCGRIKKVDCQVLVEKLIAIIRDFGTKRHSYARGLVLVNSVFTAICSYWVNIFLIPKGVLNNIKAIYKNFWDGKIDYMRVPLVSWNKVCAPKKEDCLGIRDSYSWNVAVMGKLVRVSDKLVAGYSNEVWDLDKREVKWHKLIWTGWCILKHQFVGWLIAREALQVRDKLHHLGIVADATSLICGKDIEAPPHLFHEYKYSRNIFDMMNGNNISDLVRFYLLFNNKK
ncbi:uncharacterized protein LOC141648161 [Silene latifolia]|uniref:uncharacterized protein LOC141648161 n=1 Tax=Silene latifolia TaxID=37657 RepID=UPI003D778A7C